MHKPSVTGLLPPLRIWAISVLGCVSIIPLLVGPIITGVLVDQGGLTDSAAGLTAGFRAIGGVSIALICALAMHHLPLRRLAVAGLVLAVAGNLGAAFYYEKQTLFYTLRILSAFGDVAINIGLDENI